MALQERSTARCRLLVNLLIHTDGTLGRVLECPAAATIAGRTASQFVTRSA
jgi:hypothetical protein